MEGPPPLFCSLLNVDIQMHGSATPAFRTGLLWEAGAVCTVHSKHNEENWSPRATCLGGSPWPRPKSDSSNATLIAQFTFRAAAQRKTFKMEKKYYRIGQPNCV